MKNENCPDLEIPYVFNKTIKIVQQTQQTIVGFRFHEFELIELFCNIIRDIKCSKNRSTVIDIGAHVGAFTLSADILDVKFVSFEPDPINFGILQRNVVLNSLTDVVLMPFAVGDFNGESLMHTNPNQRGLNTLGNNIKRFSPHTSEDLRVNVVRLDSLNFHNLIAMKIDVEGGELEVLKGALGTLKVHRPMIFLEWDKRNMEQFNYSPREIVRVLRRSNYFLYFSVGRNRLYFRRHVPTILFHYFMFKGRVLFRLITRDLGEWRNRFRYSEH